MKDQVVSPEFGSVSVCVLPLPCNLETEYLISGKIIHSGDQYTVIEAEIIGGKQCKLEYSEENQYYNSTIIVYEPIKT